MIKIQAVCFTMNLKETNEIDLNLKKIHLLLHSDGNVDIIKFERRFDCQKSLW
jgi:hypothetical protein